MRWSLLLPSLLPALASAVTGHGPRSVHPINDRYLAVADSSIDSLLVLDARTGGSVVGHFVLHDRGNDADKSSWLNPLSIASCGQCKHVFVVSGSMLYAVALDRPLAAMAEEQDFSSLSGSTIRPFWPEGWHSKYREDGLLRAVSVASDGSTAYVAHSRGGIFSFDPLSPAEADRRSKHVIHVGDADVGDGIQGLHHTTSLRNLIVTRDKYVHIVKLRDEDGANPLDYGEPVAYGLPLDYHCDKLYDGEEMMFVDTVIINEYAFVMGKPAWSDESDHAGVQIYRLTWYEDDEAWHNCVPIAGRGLEDPGWIDGAGYDALFSATPHDMAVLPTADSHTIVVADVDNRALRYVDVTVPVETDDQIDRVRVTSVPYDEDLWKVLYSPDAPWTALDPEAVMEQDGKSYYHSGDEGLYSMDFDEAQDECSRVGIGRVCTLPELRARFARGQYPTLDGDDGSWTTVWTAEKCISCHLQSPGRCDIGDPEGWGQGSRMIAVFNPRAGLETQCVDGEMEVDTMSMCCGLGGPAVLNPETASAEGASTQKASAAVHPAAVSTYAVFSLILFGGVGYGAYMWKRPKPSWWPDFLRNDRREDTGHAPHREVDLRGRDYI